MASRLTDRLARRLRFVPRGTEPGTDADLLRRFTQHRDEEAFADLVHRHGPVVLAVCRRALGDTPDAEDAFQTTFLVLARRAGAIRRGGSVGCWLYGVALRVSRKACRRRPPPPVASARPGPPDPAHEAAWRELAAVLDEELARLPDRLRDPLVMCYLHGRTRDEAAGELGWSLSTLKRRLDRAREVLRARLTGRGIAPPVGLLGAVGLAWAPPAAAIPAPLRMATLAAVAGKATGGGDIVQRLADGVLVGTGLVRMKLAVGALLMIAVVAAGVGLAGGAAAPPEVAQPTPPTKTEPPVVAPGPAAPPIDPLRPAAVARLGGGSLWMTDPNCGRRLAFPADGRTVFGVSDEWGVTQWDLFTGKVIRRFTPYGPRVSGDAAVSADGKLLAVTVVQTPGVTFWDVEREALLWEKTSLEASVDRRPSLSLSPDGRVLALWGEDSANISLWDTTQRKMYATMSLGQLNNVIFTPDSKTLITASKNDAAIRIWDVTTGRGRMSIVCESMATLAVSPDGKTVASASNTGVDVNLWNLMTGRKLRALDGGPEFASLAFSPNGQQLVASNAGRTVVWDVGTGKVERQFEIAGTNPIQGLNQYGLSSDGRTLMVQKHYDRRMKFIDESISISYKLSSVIQAFDTITGKERFPVTGHTVPIRQVAFSPDGRMLVTNGDTFDLKFWDTQTGRVVSPFPKPLAPSKVFARSADSRALAVANEGGVVVYDAKTGAELRRLDRRMSRIQSIVFVGPGGPLAINDYHTVSLWDWAGKGAVKPLAGVKKAPIAQATSPDGRWVAVAVAGPEVPREYEVGLWDAATGKIVRTIVESNSSVSTIEFGQDSKTLAVSSRQIIQLYDVADGTTGRKFETGVTASVTAVAFSPDGAHLAAVSQEGPVVIMPDGNKWGSACHPMVGYVRVWEVATGRLVRQFRDPGNTLNCLAYAPDGKRIATAGVDGVITIWDVATPTPLAPLPEEIPFPKQDGKQPAPVAIPPEKLVRLWDALGGADVRAGLRAANDLVATGNQAVAFLATRVKPVPAPDAAKLAKLVTEVGDDRFATREQATAELAKMGELAAPALRARLKDNPSAEVSRRASDLLDRPRPELPTGDRLRELVAVGILQRIKTPEAKRVLTELAAGAEGARLTQDAREAKAAAGKP